MSNISFNVFNLNILINVLSAPIQNRMYNQINNAQCLHLQKNTEARNNMVSPQIRDKELE